MTYTRGKLESLPAETGEDNSLDGSWKIMMILHH